ncbi:hypothetical protein FQN60_002704, partial [Etheostoma spectabile]
LKKNKISTRSRKRVSLKLHSTKSSTFLFLLRTSSILTRAKASQRLTKDTHQTSSMENMLQDPDSRKRRISARQAEGVKRPAARCPCCRDDQVPHLKQKRPHSAARGDRPQKRKRTSVARPPKHSAENPASEVSTWGPSPQPSTPDVEIAGLLGLVPQLE